MKFDAETYTITIRKEECDAEFLYVGRVAEFPNISAYEDTFEAARALVIDSIQTLKKIADETQADFPIPYPVVSDEFSGRVTLRLSKSLHAQVSRLAAQEEISVNQYLVTAIAYYAGETNGTSKLLAEAVNLLGHVVTTAMSQWWTRNFISKEVFTTPSLTKKIMIGGIEISMLPAPQKMAATCWPTVSKGVVYHG